MQTVKEQGLEDGLVKLNQLDPDVAVLEVRDVLLLALLDLLVFHHHLLLRNG